MGEKALPTKSIYGWDPTTSTWLKILVDADGKVQITNTDLTTILSEIQSETYGLEAIKDAIDEIEAGSGATPQQIWEYVTRTLTSIPAGSALEATLTAIKGTGWSTETLKAIKDAIDAIEAGTGTLAEEVWEYITRRLTNLDDTRAAKIDSIPNLALEATLTAIKGAGWTDENIKEIVDYLENATFGLSAIEVLVNDIKTAVTIIDGIVDAIKLKTDTIVWTDITTIDGIVDAIKLKTDTINWADITAILSDTNAIKLKTDLIPADIATQLDTNIPAIKTETDKIAAVKSKTDLIPASPASTGDVTTAHGITDGKIDGVQMDTTAIKAKTDNLPTDPADESLLEAILTAIKGADWTTETLKAIKDAIDVIETALPSDPADQSGVEAAITAAHLTTDGKVDDVEAKLDHATYGLSALKTLIDDIESKVDDVEGKTGNLPSDPADESAVEAAITAAHSATETKIERKITHMDFWADNTAQVVLTTVATADYALSALTVAGIPTGATLVRVVALLKIAVIRDTSASNNAVNGATSLKVDADVAYGSLVTAIDIADDSWAVLVANGADRGGDIMIGDNDVKTEITGNGTFYARLENIACDGNNLKLEDVAWGVRIYFY